MNRTGHAPRRITWLAMLLGPLLPAAALHAGELLDEVLVTGEQPGPAMWKVSKDGHTLWVVGTLTPLPTKMTWRSKQVEAVIARSGEILGGYSGRAQIKGGNFAALRFVPAIMRLRYNIDRKTLREVLPPDVYARWSAAHLRFFGHEPDQKERARPIYAADLLYEQALKRSGLSTDDIVWDKVDDLSQRHKVRVRKMEFTFPVDDPKGMLRDLAVISPERETACLVATLDRIDQDLPNMKRRAQAWAVGDVATLRALPYTTLTRSCVEAFMEKPSMRKLIDEARAKVDADRPGIVAYMLLAHETSFSAEPIDELLKPDGVVAKWRAAGYAVQEP